MRGTGLESSAATPGACPLTSKGRGPWAFLICDLNGSCIAQNLEQIKYMIAAGRENRKLQIGVLPDRPDSLESNLSAPKSLAPGRP